MGASVARADFVDHDPDLEPVFAESGERGGAGVAFLDYDQDGDLDFLVTHAGDGVRLYANDGPPDYALRDVTDDAGLPVAAPKSNGLAIADIDRDGWPDIVIADRLEGLRLHRNDAGVFADWTAYAVPGPTFYTASIAATDVDGDGWVDLFVGGYTGAEEGTGDCTRDTVFLNRGDGTFTDEGLAWGLDDHGCALAVMASDFDRDGDADLLVANDYGPIVAPDQLLRNDGPRDDGGVVLTDVSRTSGFDHRIYGMGLATADVDGNGAPDYFATSIGRPILLLGGPDGTFTDGTEAYGVGAALAFTSQRATWGATFLDVEMDGALDLAVASGFIPSRWENPSDAVQPSLLFSDVSSGAGEDVAGSLGIDADDASRGLALGDFDGDGDDDLATAAIGGLVHLYRNDADPAPVLRVRLRGTVSNIDGLGGLVTLSCAGVHREREVVPSGSYASAHDPEVRIALAGCEAGGDLEIRWPSGVSERIAIGGESALLVRSEPRWIEVDPEWLPADGASTSVVHVTPRGGDGTPIGAGHAVTVTSAQADVAPVVDRGDGTYEAVVTAADAAGSAPLRIVVDGTEAPAHPRVRFFPAGGDRTVLRAFPVGYVAGEAITVTLAPKDHDGVLDGPGKDVALSLVNGTLTGGVTDLGDGRYEAIVTGGAGGPLGITARVDGLLRAAEQVPEVLAIDPARSDVSMLPAALSRETAEKEGFFVSVLVAIEDGLGRPLDPALHTFSLWGRSGLVVPLSEQRSNHWTANVLPAMAAAESPLEVRADDVLLVGRANFRVYDDPAEVVDLVDPERSKLSPHQETVHADGEDYAWVFVTLEDADGGRLPFAEGLAVESDAMAAVEEVAYLYETDARVRMRATGAPGTGTIDVTWGGEPIGVSTTVELLPPRVHDVGALGVTTCVESRRAPADGEAAVGVFVRPHDADGFLSGSAVPVSITVDGEARPLDYARPGTYVGSIPPQSAEATVEVETALEGRTSRIDVSFETGSVPAAREACVELEAPDPDGDAGPDAGDDPDAGGDDAPTDPVPGVRGGGCACHAVGGPGRGGIAILALFAIVAMALRRRTSILALLLVPALGRAEFVDHDPDFEPTLFSSDDSMGGGAAFADWDGDGDLDFAVTLGQDGVRLYDNGGAPDFVFTDVSADVDMPDDTPFSFGIAASDFDRDGDLDFVYADRFEGLRLLDDRGGFFEDVSAFAVTRREWYPSSVAVGDLDGDGWTDVWAAAYTTWYDGFFHVCAHDTVFHNQGDGTFEEVSDAWGVADEGCTLAVLLSDYDLDGDPDALLGNDFGQFVVPNRLYRNDGLDAAGGVAWTDVSHATGFDRRVYSMGLATADVDGNGRPDYFTTSIGRTSLLLGQEDGTFVDATEAYGVASAYSIEDWRATWGPSFLDVESDGAWDLYVAAGYLPAAFEVRNGGIQPSLFYPGLDAAAPSHDAARTVGLEGSAISHGSAVGDFDADGDDDLVVVSLGSDLHLFRNEADPAPVARIRLHGTVSNPEALNAQATLSCAGVTRWREAATGGSYASMHSSEIRMPLAGCEAGGAIEIRWPSGLVEDVPVDGASVLVERTEPAFFEVETPWLPADGSSSTTVRLSPRAPDGSLLGAGHAVTMTATSGALSAVVDRGDGTYDATLTAPAAAGSSAITATIDGIALAAHPRARFYSGDRTAVRASPLEYVAGETDVLVTVLPRDASGAPDGPGKIVTILPTGGDVVGAVTDLGDGRYVAAVHGDGGIVNLRAEVDGVSRGPSVDLAEIRAIDPAASMVRMSPGAISRDAVDAGDLVAIQISPRDTIGIPVENATDHVYEVTGRSGVVVPIERGKFSAYYSESYLATDVEGEGPFEVRVDGVLLDRRPDLVVYDEDAELADLVDPARSLMATYHETAHADGEDYAWIIVRLQTAGGDKLPWIDGFAIESDEMTFVEDRSDRLGLEYKARMRATGLPGEATLDVTFDGVPIGLRDRVILLPSVDHDLGALGVRTCPTASRHEANGIGSVGVFVRPHDETDVLVGSNVPLGFYVDGVEQPLEYGLPGGYLAEVRTPGEPKRVFVQTELLGTGRGSTTWVDFYEDGEEPDLRDPCVDIEDGFVRIEPEVDAGPDAGGEDAGGSDAGVEDAGGDGGNDAGVGADGGGDGGGDRRAARGGGCACRATGEREPLAWIGALAAALALGTSRRRPG